MTQNKKSISVTELVKAGSSRLHARIFSLKLCKMNIYNDLLRSNNCGERYILVMKHTWNIVNNYKQGSSMTLNYALFCQISG